MQRTIKVQHAVYGRALSSVECEADLKTRCSRPWAPSDSPCFLIACCDRSLIQGRMGETLIAKVLENYEISVSCLQ